MAPFSNEVAALVQFDGGGVAMVLMLRRRQVTQCALSKREREEEEEEIWAGIRSARLPIEWKYDWIERATRDQNHKLPHRISCLWRTPGGSGAAQRERNFLHWMADYLSQLVCRLISEQIWEIWSIALWALGEIGFLQNSIATLIRFPSSRNPFSF